MIKIRQERAWLIKVRQERARLTSNMNPGQLVQKVNCDT